LKTYKAITRINSFHPKLHSPAPPLPLQTFMHQHLQQRLVTHSFSLGDLSSLSDIRFWQPDGNLRTLPLPAQLATKGEPDTLTLFACRAPDLRFT
jgi:hypothetical protein